MGRKQPTAVRLKDYAPFGYRVESTELRFALHPNRTRVASRIRFAPNPQTTNRTFMLHGEGLKLRSARIDGAAISPRIEGGTLSCDAPDAAFEFEAEVEIDPSANTALEGLYMSNGIYCTQCEAEGFRRITFYPDRPDVMAPFSVRIEGDAPVMLSNGNPAGRGDGFAEWRDPWPKPAYLFALVAGNLVSLPDRFVTASGREVELNVWSAPGNEGKCAFAMESLKKAMAWDERVYGREYDLDVFNIVAIDDFNMGAMENKGLNVFNSSAALASPETSTDADHERIEAIIAHEYFHNWTGNRITCRDWFQLCLKEGLTVFRDAEFTADERSAPVKRISDAVLLRARQFREDGGPLAHPVRPDSYVEINNFYTATVYEKGAEVVGMLKTLVGEDGYRAALDLYFSRHDGQAVTIEDWLKAFEDATGRDLAQFARWYTDAGTPSVRVRDEFANGTYTLHLEQSTPATPGQTQKPPRVIPMAVGLMGRDGAELRGTTVLEMTEERQNFSFEGLAERPTPSVLRGFSAPVAIDHDLSEADLALLLAHDTDPFGRWEAGRLLSRKGLLATITHGAPPDAAYIEAIGATLRDEALDPAFRALALRLPSQDELAQDLAEAGIVPDPQIVWDALDGLAQARAEALADTAREIHGQRQVAAPYRPDPGQCADRTLANAALDMVTRVDAGALAQAQFDAADNMTQQLAAFACLLKAVRGDAAIAAFEDQWRHDRLVMDKWFAMQVVHAKPERTAAVAEELTRHPDFGIENPNRFRSVLGALSANPAGFHRESGEAYKLLAEWLVRLDGRNPQAAARMCTAFETWRLYDERRQKLAADQLDWMLGHESLSRDVSDMIGRIRAG